MQKDFGEGIFDMEFINQAYALGDLAAAKNAAHEKIKASTANVANKMKATAMVNKAATLSKLIHGLTNFSLAHQGLKAIR